MWTWSSLSTMWIPGIECRRLGLVVTALPTHCASSTPLTPRHLLQQLQMFKLGCLAYSPPTHPTPAHGKAWMSAWFTGLLPGPA